jgi:hypothetical protein
VTAPGSAEPSRAEPSRAEPSRAEPSRAEPSRAEPSRHAAPARMWEVRAAPGRLADLAEFVLRLLPDRAQVYRSRAAAGDERLVVIDFALRPVPELPPDLVARPPHSWDFERIR